jgi:hypothetical protein
MQLEFIDTGAVRWRVNLDFFIPSTAPTVSVGGELIRLIPITDLPKGEFSVVNQCDGQASPVWQPITEENTQRLASALVYWASEVLEMKPEQLPEPLVEELARIVSAKSDDLLLNPPALFVAGALIDAERWYHTASSERLDVDKELGRARFLDFGRRRERRRRRAGLSGRSSRARNSLRQARTDWEGTEVSVRGLALRLMENALFRSQLEELARNAVLVVGVAGAPGARRILEFTYEAPLTFRYPAGRWARLFQNLGWRSWSLVTLIDGRGGSQQLQVTVPAGAEIVRITANPAVPEITAKAVTVSVGRPHTSIQLPAGGQVRYQATIFVRIARPGWLTSSWLVAVAVGYGMVAARLRLDVFFSVNPVAANTVVTLVPGLLGVFTALLVGGRVHPFVARLLLPLKLLIVFDFGIVLIAFGSLLLHSSNRLPVLLWTALADLAVAVAVLVTISWFLPLRRVPRQE